MLCLLIIPIFSSLNLGFGFLHTEKLCLHHPHVPVSLLSIQFRHYCQNSCITVEIAMPNTKWVDGHRRHHLVSFGHGGNSRPTEQALRDILSFCWRSFTSFYSGMFNHMQWLIVTFQDRWHPDASMIANRLEVAPPNILDLQDRERPSWAFSTFLMENKMIFSLQRVPAFQISLAELAAELLQSASTAIGSFGARGNQDMESMTITSPTMTIISSTMSNTFPTMSITSPIISIISPTMSNTFPAMSMEKLCLSTKTMAISMLITSSHHQWTSNVRKVRKVDRI